MTNQEERFKPVPGAEPISNEAIDHQLDFAQNNYDASGRFYWAREVNYSFSLTCDTRGSSRLPAMYQTEAAQLSVLASKQRGNIGVGVSIETPDGTKDVYGTHAGGDSEDDLLSEPPEDLPIITALLDAAHVEVAELETRPRRVMEQLVEQPPADFKSFQQHIIQKTYDPNAADPENDESAAMHVRIVKLSGTVFPESMTIIHISRPVEFDGARHVYTQSFQSTPDGYVQSDTVTLQPRPYSLGKREDQSYGYQLTDDPRLLEQYRAHTDTSEHDMSMNSFMARLIMGENAYVGALTTDDVNRLISEPLTAEHSLKLS